MPQFRVCERELQANRRGNCQKKQKIREHLFRVPKGSPQRQESEQQGIQTDKFSKNQQEEDRPTKDQPPCSPAVSMEEQGDQRQGDSRDAEMYRLSPKSGHSGFKQIEVDRGRYLAAGPASEQRAPDQLQQSDRVH